MSLSLDVSIWRHLSPTLYELTTDVPFYGFLELKFLLITLGFPKQSFCYLFEEIAVKRRLTVTNQFFFSHVEYCSSGTESRKGLEMYYLPRYPFPVIFSSHIETQIRHSPEKGTTNVFKKVLESSRHRTGVPLYVWIESEPFGGSKRRRSHLRSTVKTGPRSGVKDLILLSTSAYLPEHKRCSGDVVFYER